MMPITEADLVEGGSKRKFLVVDATTGEKVLQGPI